jgi:hypothetical protein
MRKMSPIAPKLGLGSAYIKQKTIKYGHNRQKLATLAFISNSAASK